MKKILFITMVLLCIVPNVYCQTTRHISDSVYTYLQLMRNKMQKTIDLQKTSNNLVWTDVNTNILTNVCTFQKKIFGNNSFTQLLCLYREQSQWYLQLKYSMQSDTIYLYENCVLELAQYYCAVWSKKDTLVFSNYQTGQLEIYQSSLPMSEIKLITEWNITEIREKEKTGIGLLPRGTIVATKIIIHNGRYRIIDCIKFDEF